MPNGANVGYDAKLWHVTDAFGGSLDAAEYKFKYGVGGLVFLKYISDAVEELHAKLKAEWKKSAEESLRPHLKSCPKRSAMCHISHGDAFRREHRPGPALHKLTFGLGAQS